MNSDGNTSLREFLAHFDFDYDIVSPGGKYETKIRQELLEDDLLFPNDMDKDLICLIDCQGAYLGDIGKMRYPFQQDSVAKIIDRLDTYIQDSVIEEFETALEDRNIDPSELDLENLISKCRDLNVVEGEVCYSLAEVIAHPDKIYIEELNQRERPSLDTQIQNAQRGGTTRNSEFLEYDHELASRCNNLQGVDVLTHTSGVS